jgi:hypothetical protein
MSRENVDKVKGLFHVVMPALADGNLGAYDGAYLDGSHSEFNTRVCTEAIWRLLKPGAILVFDDYGNPDYPGVKFVIDTFLAREDTQYEMLFKGPPHNTQLAWQVIVVKVG